MVTLWALFCSLVPALLFVVYDASLNNSYPFILHLIAAVGIFFYQTLDALDGKQARRLKAFSPLGQLFDHGCDSFSAASFVLFLLVCLKLPSANMNLLMYLAAIVMVYMSNLCEKYTHVLTTSYGQLGVTEIQFLQMAALLLTGFGWMDWMYLPLVAGLGINHLIAWTIVGFSAFSCYYFLNQIFATDCDKQEVFLAMAPLGYILVPGTLI